MKTDGQTISWTAFGLFYVVLIAIVTILDAANGVLRLPYWAMQVALITVGVGIFLLTGYWVRNLTPAQSVLLAFGVGILTIIPAVLMGLGPIPGLWPQYFYIALGMATGSLLTFLFINLYKRLSN